MSGPVVFIHVPKTGGSTFLSVLRRNFPASDVLLPDAQKDKNPVEIDQALTRLSAQHARSIHGHFPLSYRDRLPSNARYATILRDPVQRQYSHYQWSYGRKLAAGKDWPVSKALGKGRLVLRADRTLSTFRPTTDLAALGYVADYGVSAIGARARRVLQWR